MTLQLLSATFSLPLHPKEIRRWRGAWAEMAGLEHDVFHNHQPGERNYHHRYPLVQYRSRGRKAAILALNDATSAVQRALLDKNWTINWNDEPTSLGLESLQLETFELHMPKQPVSYLLRGYLPFNDDNFREYQAAADIYPRIDLLHKMLVGHLLGCMKALGYHLPERLEVNITHLDRTSTVDLHHVLRPTFDLRFKTNLFLPPGIGLGKGVSHGHGVLLRERKNTEPRPTSKETNKEIIPKTA